MFYDLLKSRRSIRKFQSRQVEKEKMDTILKSALLAPSSRAIRPWEFIAVTDRKLLKELSGCKEYGSDFLAGAPLGIVVVADPEVCDVWVEDASIASIIIQLSAQSLDLSSCWIQVRQRFHSAEVKAEDYIKGVLGIPEKYSIECIVAIGYPAEEKRAYGDDELLYDKIHINRF
jgi:nitroreductase